MTIDVPGRGRSVAVEDLHVTLDGGAEILRGVDLSIAAGEWVCVTGPSGSGKTTLLRTVAGLVRPTSGRVALDGREATSIRPEKRRIGFLFQGRALWPHLSASGHLETVFRAQGMARSERARKAVLLLGRVHLEDKADARPGTLSGGEAQRLALARALAVEPGLLLLDEPLAPLDADLRADLETLLRNVRKSLKCTVLHVTHDADEAARLADRTVFMAEGRLQDAGSG